jgi:uncharacterized membrane protein YfcA
VTIPGIILGSYLAIRAHDGVVRVTLASVLVIVGVRLLAMTMTRTVQVLSLPVKPNLKLKAWLAAGIVAHHTAWPASANFSIESSGS